MWGGPEELIEILAATPVVLRQLVAGVDDEAARQSGGAGGWAIVEVVAHLCDAEERAADRIRLITTASEEEPVIEGYDQIALAEQRAYRSMALSETLDRFERLRAARLELLAALDELDWIRTGRHADSGTLTLHALTTHMCKHDAIHLAQIARLRAAG